MNTEFYTFGEILRACLPSGRHPGGAPFNVAAHLAQLGVSVCLLSAVGQDSLGDEILEVAQHKGINVQFVGRARIGLPTGTVVATVDAGGPRGRGESGRAYLRLAGQSLAVQSRTGGSSACGQGPAEILR